MLKKRYGKLTETIPSRQWRWEIGDWERKKHYKIMDSDLMKSESGVEFHFHMVVEEKDGVDIVGFYIHYKARPIPKYTYAIGSTKGRVVRQHTAHSIPPECKRCGHYMVCQKSLVDAAVRKANDDTCVVWFQFDNDTVANTGNLGEYVWTIPSFRNIRIGPYYSKGFSRINQEDMCCIKFNVHPEKRTNVTLQVSQRQHRNIPCWFKITNLQGELLYQSSECRPGRWPSIPYSLLLKTGCEGTLVVYVSYVKEAVKEEEKQPVTSVHGILPPPGKRGATREDADGVFNLMDEDGFQKEDGDMDVYSEIQSECDEEAHEQQQQEI
eukprot:TRINITY_DN6946_c0_g4_i1.p1 TRINITY_DN6946_c0_g4~~TRINITY_DN6946_c0_g4_i1.p1  ORF type:complete len:324 (+),score=85.74 TRINITY_DN6946_c0_g4_i1:115-1086(+)